MARLREARQAIDDLRQPAGHDLAEAAEQEAERFTLATGIACEPVIELAGGHPGSAVRDGHPGHLGRVDQYRPACPRQRRSTCA